MQTACPPSGHGPGVKPSKAAMAFSQVQGIEDLFIAETGHTGQAPQK